MSKYSGHAHEDSKLLPEAATVANGVAVDLSLIQWFYTVEGTEYGPYDTNTMSQWYAAGQLTADLNIRKGLDVVPESERNEFLNEDYIMLTDHFEPGQEFLVLKQGNDENGKLASDTLRTYLRPRVLAKARIVSLMSVG